MLRVRQLDSLLLYASEETICLVLHCTKGLVQITCYFHEPVFLSTKKGQNQQLVFTVFCHFLCRHLKGKDWQPSVDISELHFHSSSKWKHELYSAEYGHVAKWSKRKLTKINTFKVPIHSSVFVFYSTGSWTFIFTTTSAQLASTFQLWILIQYKVIILLILDHHTSPKYILES